MDFAYLIDRSPGHLAAEIFQEHWAEARYKPLSANTVFLSFFLFLHANYSVSLSDASLIFYALFALSATNRLCK